jgi:aspartate ammonia-lyase
MTATRTESDALGPIEVPEDALYGAHTARALENFPGAAVRVMDRPDLIRGLAHVKAAAAQANAELGVIDPRVAAVIVEAADEIVGGMWHEALGLALVHGGGGTATNMAVNEVVANRAAQILGHRPGRYDVVHPLEHVNRSQSTNDVYPTALQLAALERTPIALAALSRVAEALDGCAAGAGDLQRLGRTCLQDALPLPVDAYHHAQARAIRRAARGLADAAAPLHAVPLGATAVGTGAGAPPGYRALAVERLAARSARALRPAEDPFDALAHLDPLLTLAAAAATAAITSAKIASDLRLLASGPLGGIAEVRLPDVQVGSSIMPGKSNPVIAEHVIQASFEIRGAMHTVEAAVAAGELDLNVMEPVIARHLLEALEQLATVSDTFASRCLAGLAWDRASVERHLEGSRLADVERVSR